MINQNIYPGVQAYLQIKEQKEDQFLENWVAVMSWKTGKVLAQMKTPEPPLLYHSAVHTV